MLKEVMMIPENENISWNIGPGISLKVTAFHSFLLEMHEILFKYCDTIRL